MDNVKRIAPPDAAKLVEEGEALLICAYEDEEKWKRLNLKGSISVGEFRRLRPTLPKDKTLIFYCA